MREPDDLETALALGVVDAVARGEHDVLAEVLVGLDQHELRRLVGRLAGLVHLRGDVGRDQPSTVAWCEFLRRHEGLVL